MVVFTLWWPRSSGDSETARGRRRRHLAEAVVRPPAEQPPWAVLTPRPARFARARRTAARSGAVARIFSLATPSRPEIAAARTGFSGALSPRATAPLRDSALPSCHGALRNGVYAPPELRHAIPLRRVAPAELPHCQPNCDSTLPNCDTLLAKRVTPFARRATQFQSGALQLARAVSRKRCRGAGERGSVS